MGKAPVALALVGVLAAAGIANGLPQTGAFSDVSGNPSDATSSAALQQITGQVLSSNTAGNGSSDQTSGGSSPAAGAASSKSEASGTSSGDTSGVNKTVSSSNAANNSKAAHSKAANNSKANNGSLTTSSLSTSSTKSAASYKAHAWKYSNAPLYYTVRGKANTSVKVKKGKTKMAGWDKLGRTKRVVTKVTYKMVADSAGWRESMPASADTISGWGKQSLVSVSLSNGRTYNGYAWNRSHLLADCLGGHAIKENLVTGTRTQNVGNNVTSAPGGMQYTEQLALNYLNSHHKGWVYYRATPVYKGKELVCRSVYVDILSNDGSINQHVEVYNAMRGVKINYKTGAVSGKAVKKAGSSSSSKGSSSSNGNKNNSTSTSTTGGKWVYVTNTGTKYHAASCKYLASSKHKIKLKAAKAQGYTACKVCGG